VGGYGLGIVRAEASAKRRGLRQLCATVHAGRPTVVALGSWTSSPRGLRGSAMVGVWLPRLTVATRRRCFAPDT
jgi:hypothetical protein